MKKYNHSLNAWYEYFLIFIYCEKNHIPLKRASFGIYQCASDGHKENFLVYAVTVNCFTVLHTILNTPCKIKYLPEEVVKFLVMVARQILKDFGFWFWISMGKKKCPRKNKWFSKKENPITDLVEYRLNIYIFISATKTKEPHNDD